MMPQMSQVRLRIFVKGKVVERFNRVFVTGSVVTTHTTRRTLTLRPIDSPAPDALSHYGPGPDDAPSDDVADDAPSDDEGDADGTNADGTNADGTNANGTNADGGVSSKGAEKRVEITDGAQP